MRFDSAEFLVFFAGVLLLHRLLPWRRALLVATSWLFYASWNPPFLLLLLASTALDYRVALALEATERPARRRALLGLSLAGNLGVLAYFKYVGFLLDQLPGLDPALLAPFRLETAIPLGISFYTFQTVGYTVDVYRRRIPACRSALDFALFVGFFPQLIAGPVLRAAEFLPQIPGNRRADESAVLEGVELCAIGLFKKVVIADGFAQIVDRCFGDPGAHSGAALLVATFAFSAQIYCDFDGYSTMAQGLARLLGYRIPANFDAPLLAGDPVEYRRRWHVTMGAWFRDYVYRPLGGDRHGLARTIRNTMVTWTLFGLWHGAAWTFVVWGFYNGLLLSAYRALQARGALPLFGRLSTALGYAAMPVFVGFANLFFRAGDLDVALLMLRRIFTWAPGTETVHPAWGLGLLGLYAFHWACRIGYRELLLPRVGWPARLALVGGALAVIVLLGGAGEPFYYFQF